MFINNVTSPLLIEIKVVGRKEEREEGNVVMTKISFIILSIYVDLYECMKRFMKRQSQSINGCYLRGLDFMYVLLYSFVYDLEFVNMCCKTHNKNKLFFLVEKIREKPKKVNILSGLMLLHFLLCRCEASLILFNPLSNL